MAKKIIGIIKLQVPAGKANPSPPIGPALGQRGLNIMEFCKAFNAATQNLEPGMPIPVVITAYADRSFAFVTKSPPNSFFLKKAAGVEKGAQTTGKGRPVGRVTMAQIREIAEQKMQDLNANDLDGACRMLIGSARSIAMRVSVPGVATGLAWTPVGGDILFIEATRVPGRGALILTGQLGEVMRESVQAALTLVKSRASQLGIDPMLFEKSDIHVHVPAGATPKDGPSAGVAMFTALTSLLTNRTVRADTAMTGEISLRGLVLPVGGIKEKVVAAAAAGLTRVMLPARNRRDYDDIPKTARDKLEFIWLEQVDDAIANALAEAPQPAAAAE